MSLSATSMSACSAALLASFCFAETSFWRMSGRSSTVVSAFVTYDLALSIMDWLHPIATEFAVPPRAGVASSPALARPAVLSS